MARIAVDIGQGGSRASAHDTCAHDTCGSPIVGPSAVPLLDSASADTIADRVIEFVVRLGIPRIETVTVGMTGFKPDLHLLLRAAARITHATSARSVTIADDVLTGYMGALGPVPGVVVTAGTGSVALGIAYDYTWRKADGHGYMLGDHGSGFWIGQQGVQAALAALDNRGRSTTLVDAIVEQYGSTSGLRDVIYSSTSPAPALASLAPTVIEASRSGDTVAADIVRRAARYLACAAAACAPSTEEVVPVVLTGGLSQSDYFWSRFADAVAAELPAADLQIAAGSPLDGADVLSQQAESWHLPGLVAHYRLD